MSVPPIPSARADDAGAALIARTAARRRRAGRRLAGMIDDVLQPDELRLDDRSRASVRRLLAGMVAAIERRLRSAVTPANEASEPTAAVLGRLTTSGLLRDPVLAGELIGRARLDRLATTAPRQTNGGLSLLTRLTTCPDAAVAAAAGAVLAAANRRADAAELGAGELLDLPDQSRERLIWWTAAALCADPACDQAESRTIVAAAHRMIAGANDDERLETAADRLAVAVAARPDEIGSLLVEAIGDGQMVVATALLAHVLALDFVQARDLVVDPAGEELVLALRAADLDRRDIEQIGSALLAAEPARDGDLLADAIDAVATIDPAVARLALASRRHPPQFLVAVDALSRSEPA